MKNIVYSSETLSAPRINIAYISIRWLPIGLLKVEDHVPFDAVVAVDEDPHEGGKELSEHQPEEKGQHDPVETNAAVAEDGGFEDPGQEDRKPAVGDDGVGHGDGKADRLQRPPEEALAHEEQDAHYHSADGGEGHACAEGVLGQVRDRSHVGKRPAWSSVVIPAIEIDAAVGVGHFHCHINGTGQSYDDSQEDGPGESAAGAILGGGEFQTMNDGVHHVGRGFPYPDGAETQAGHVLQAQYFRAETT